MEFYIGETSDKTLLSSLSTAARNSDGGLFQSELNDAIDKQSVSLRENSGKRLGCFGGDTAGETPMVVISRGIEEKMRNDPEYSEEISQKLNELLQNQGKSIKDKIVVINRDGEITQYCTRPKRAKDHPTSEELKEVAKARARRKARLDAYFRLLERDAIKRKLIEQENAKRLLDKKKRLSVSALDMMAKSQQIKNPPAFTSRILF